MIYLDYQATTPLAPEVGLAMQPWIEEKFANPHSPRFFTKPRLEVGVSLREPAP